ncbi:hypothetical protein [Xanthomonas sp. fls2-241-TYG-148]|uniref:hypothetical protein n=1 Tax=Xanthomonas sp. fls2-241-TYG-148 TaxID=3040328 RepID=UPI0025525AED|nr:hypothetical protein [Xanthomonas sp. fls2-241-TYG-148]
MLTNYSAKKTSVITVIGAVLVGGFTGWALAETRASGWSRADLVSLAAALGTWAVGIGAFFYARAAHLLRETELRKIEAAERHEENAAFNATRGRLAALAAPAAICEDANAANEIESQVGMRRVVRLIQECTPTGSLLEIPGKYMAGEILTGLVNVTVLASMLRGGCEDLLEELTGSFAPTNGHLKARFSDICEIADGLRDEAQRSSDDLEELRLSILDS